MKKMTIQEYLVELEKRNQGRVDLAKDILYYIEEGKDLTFIEVLCNMYIDKYDNKGRKRRGDAGIFR